jgi:hypothetical protein
VETNASEGWIKTSLAADTALTALVGTRIFNTVRDKDSALPCVVFQLQAPGNDFMVLGGARVWTPNLYLVRGIAEQDGFAGDLATIANRIDAVLHRGSGSNAAGTVFTCVRIRPFQMAEIADGRQFRHLGGIYEIRAR